MARTRPLRKLARKPIQPIRSLQSELLETRALLSATTFHPPYVLSHAGVSDEVVGLTADQVRTAYGFNQLSFGAIPADGRGQTIAIIDAYDHPNIRSDLDVFDAQMGLPPPPSFKIVNQTGGSVLPSTDPNGLWDVETALDVQWAHAMAPGANILLIEANTSGFITHGNLAATDLIAAVTYARTVPGVSVISMSFGVDDGIIDASTAQLVSNQILTTPAGHQGITFVASTGDSGIASFPSTSPNVLAVGGTRLTTDTDGAYSGESAWGIQNKSPTLTDLLNYQGSGGGGISQIFANRRVPDVSYNGDPVSGVAVYNSFGATPGWVQVGGTSAGAPQWAAIMAIVNQGRALAGLGSLYGATQTSAALYSVPYSGFHDITTGATAVIQQIPQEFLLPPILPSFSAIIPALPGYDMATGLGSPVVNKLVPSLIGFGAPAGTTLPTTLAPSSPSNFAASSPASTQVGLSWTASPGATNYDLYQNKNGQPTQIASYAPGTTSAMVNGLTAGTSYQFYLVARNSAGSAVTPWVQVTTRSAAAAAPVSPAVPVTASLANNGVLSVQGTAGDDVIIVTAKNNLIAVSGVAGTFSATLVKSIVILGGAGNDVIIIAGKQDNAALQDITLPTMIDGGNGDDVIQGGSGRDVIFGGYGSDSLLGRGGDDFLFGGPGDDALYGGDGNDTLLGGDGFDYLFGQAGGDLLSGGAGGDLLDGGADGDLIAGDAGFDAFNRSAGGDVYVDGLNGFVLQGQILGADAVRYTANPFAPSVGATPASLLNSNSAGMLTYILGQELFQRIVVDRSVPGLYYS